MTEALVQSNGVQAGLIFTADQQKMIRDSFARGASAQEFAVLMEVAKLRNLNPILRQIHFVKRKQWDGDANSYQETWSYQVSIDGLRATAERTGRYDGQDEPEFEYDKDGKLKFCRVRVYKKGIARPFVGIAHWSEYVQTKRDGTPTKMWAEKQHIMLAKCAEALGLRKAFPEETSGMYTEEEMAKATPAEEEKAAEPKKLAGKKPAVQVIEVAAEIVTPAVPEVQVEAAATPPPPTVSPAPEVPKGEFTNQKMAAEFIAICGAGFESPEHHSNWFKKHINEINGLPFPLRKAVKAAYDNAGLKE